MKKVLTILGILIVVAVGWRLYQAKFGGKGGGKGPEKMIMYRSVPVERATIVQEVSATGTVKAIQEVEVGTQVTGKVVKLLADYNSQVKAGDVVARIDPLTYEANYAAAKAQLLSAEATLAKTEAALILAEKELVRNEALLKRKMISESDYDSSLAQRDELRAQKKANLASIEQAKATVTLQKTNLDYCTIYSPVTGVVLDRDVDEGQTVVSSMNASPIFTIATDLTKIEVEASIPEADIGVVKVGQVVKFTVDAYKETFMGKVKQVRMAATTSSNVVTYPVIVEASNPDLKLFPGMTATLSVIVASEENVWSVPTAALRFKGAGTTAPKVRQGERVLWSVNAAGQLEPLVVRLGVTDNIRQQIVAEGDLGRLKIATGIMTAEERKNGGEPQVNNPFMMRPPGAPKK